MRGSTRGCAKVLVSRLFVAELFSLLALLAALSGCNGSASTMNSTSSSSSSQSSGSSSSGMGMATVTLTDPPSCAFPNGNFDHVYISVRSVQAHTSATASDNTPGWQEIAPQLNTAPKQIDLFAAASTTCVLTALGSTSALPAGTYQQIRLLLVPNDGSGGAVPLTNACAGHGYNCVFIHGNNIPVELDLSSQANTGLKIPPGQLVGGPITVGAGQDVDINIDFNSCASIVQQGNGAFRLKPVLTAGQVSTNPTGISGQVVDSASQNPITPAGQILVALEQPDSTGADVIFEQAEADSNGNFNFCPLPAGSVFDVVAVAINGGGTAYNATIATGVPGGTNLGKIPLTIETGSGPTALSGTVTATTGHATADIDASVAALQTISLAGGMRDVSIPAESSSNSLLSVSASTTCPGGAPANTNCAQYNLFEPASNPRVGIFSGGAISSYSLPAAGDVLYKVRATAAVPLSGGIADCTPSSISTSLDATGHPLKALGGATVPVQEIDFSGCS